MPVSQSYSFADLFDLTRATAGWTFNAAGALSENASGALRIDHDPATLAWRGWLIEAQATNLRKSSEAFGSADWNPGAMAVTTDAASAPDDASTADRLTEDTATSAHNIASTNHTVTSGQIYTMSVFAKAETCSTIQVMGSNSAFGSTRYANFNLASGTVGTVGADATAAIAAVGDGWYRCSITITASASVANATMAIPMTTSSTAARNPSYTGTSRTVLLWGADMKLSSVLSSYIPTAGASVTRDADDLSLYDISRWFSAAAGTVVVDFMPGQSAGDTFRGIFAIDDGTTDNRIELLMQAATPEVLLLASVNAVTTVPALSVATATALTRNTLRMSWGPAGWFASLNGAAPLTDTVGARPTNLTRVRLGNRSGTATDFLNGWLGPRFEYYATQYTDTAASDGFTIRTR